MNDFNRGNRSGGNRNFGKSRFNNDHPEMHQATCATCGKSCEVPFRPTGSKPVYCSDCFRKNTGAEQFQNRSSDRSQSADRQMYDAVCSKCGDNCKIPFRPTQGRDIFCSRCFDMQGGSEGGRPERKSFDRSNYRSNDNRSQTNEAPNYKAQFEALNAKLDTILALLQPTPVAVAPLESVINEEAIDEIVEEVQEEKKELTVKKPRKAKTATKKASPKAKKKASSKKK